MAEDKLDQQTQPIETDETAEGKDKKADGAKAAKKKKKEKSGRVLKYLRDFKGEFKKIVWPTLPTVLRNTGVTLAMCAILGLIICLIDFGLSASVDFLLKL